VRRLLLGILAVIAALAGCVAQAHDARPLSVVITAQAADVFRVVVRVPPVLDAANAPRLAWPDNCAVESSGALAFDVGASLLVRCAGGLANRPIAIEYPVYNPSITSLFRLEASDGSVTTAVLPPDALVWTVPAAPSRGAVARDYTALGFEHIWAGPDHLAFVAGLMLLARGARRIVLAVTGFTLAHSITLSLASLGVVQVPIAPVEAMIALSILFLAAEIARDEPASFSRRFPVALSFVFGLLHGFGFASALGEIGLPRAELLTGLLFFNIGVELGQLAFIAGAAALLVGWRAARALGSARDAQAGLVERHAPVWGAYLLGVPAAFWTFERTFAAFG
jgi:hydrogenase/urease accessory protein HupE